MEWRGDLVSSEIATSWTLSWLGPKRSPAAIHLYKQGMTLDNSVELRQLADLLFQRLGPEIWTGLDAGARPAFMVPASSAAWPEELCYDQPDERELGISYQHMRHRLDRHVPFGQWALAKTTAPVKAHEAAQPLSSTDDDNNIEVVTLQRDW